MAPHDPMPRLLTTLATVLALSLAAAVPPALAAPRRDVVVLRNGSRVIGEIRAMTKSRLELKTDDMGTLQIEWDNIVALTSPEFFEVEDMNGGLHFGSLHPGPGDDTLEVVAEWGNDVLPLWQVARIQLVKTKFWDKFTGSLDVGGGYTSATELLQVTFDAEVNYKRPRFEAVARADAVLTQQPEADDTQRVAFVLGYTRILKHRHRLYTLGMLEQNQELGFDLRSSLVAGWSYALARDRKNLLTGGAGLAVNREKPLEGESTTNLEAVLGLNYENFAYDFPNTDVQVTTFGFLGLSQWGRYRLEANASLRRELFSDFYVGLKAYESYDSDPATEGASKNDWGLSLTLGYSFN
jgi:hypothetical protein